MGRSPKVPIRFDEKRALEVFKQLDELWGTREVTNNIFTGVILPQDMYPAPADRLECALWFFYLALTQRGGIISESPFQLLSFVKKECPELFIPEAVVKDWNGEKVGKYLQGALDRAFPQRNEGLHRDIPKREGYKLDELGNSWFHNSRSLCMGGWEGNPLNVYAFCRDFEEAFSRIDSDRNPDRGFLGMRRKIFSLYTIWLQERGLVRHFATPIPVDFHAMRLLWALGIIDLSRLAKPFQPKPGRHPETIKGFPAAHVTERFVDTITKWTQIFLFENQIKHMHVNPALWVLSREFCAEHVQNWSQGGKKELTFIDPKELQDPGGWPKNYKNPCGLCPVERLCTRAIPAAPYYIWGLLMHVNDRVQYPIMRFPELEGWGMREYKPRKNSRGNGNEANRSKKDRKVGPPNGGTDEAVVSHRLPYED